MYYIFIIHPSINDHVDCFQSPTIMIIGTSTLLIIFYDYILIIYWLIIYYDYSNKPGPLG